MGSRDEKKQLILRCYTQRHATGPWCAICLDLNLAAQADSQAVVQESHRGEVSAFAIKSIVAQAGVTKGEFSAALNAK